MGARRGSGPLDRTQLARWLAALVSPALVMAGVAALAPHLPMRSPVLSLGAGIFAFACVSAEVLVAAAAAPLLSRRALLFLAMPIAVLACVGAAGGSLPDILVAALVTSALLAAGTLTGAVVGASIEHPGHLLVVVVVSTLVDAFSVLHPSGPTAQLVQVETAVSLLVLPWPILGTDRIEPVLGLGDVTFAAIYLAAGRRHGLSQLRTLIALAVGLAVILAVLLVAQVGIPALPFLGVAVLVSHPEARAMPRADRGKAALGVVFVAAMIAALLLAQR